jgi:hypothetical protein
MMHDQSLPMILWAEACMTTKYVQKMSPHHILKNITPEEALTRLKPEIETLQDIWVPNVFSCTQR